MSSFLKNYSMGTARKKKTIWFNLISIAIEPNNELLTLKPAFSINKIKNLYCEFATSGV